jgi:catechol 2,3-dioxygenase-like lactoylglutathione lyase family enzyme
MSPAPHVSPKIRAYGKARIDITRRARDEAEWRRLWKEPSQPYAFKPGPGWAINWVYTVEDYAAEIGFLIDVLGFPVLAFSPSQAQLASPEGGFALTILSAREDLPATPPDSVHLQLSVAALYPTVRELERRGVTFDRQPSPAGEDLAWQSAAFRTPHGIVIELVGEVQPDQAPHEPHPAEGAEQWAEGEPPEQGEAPAQADGSLDEQQQESPPLSLWQRNLVSGSSQSTRSVPAKTAKPGNGNLELTYAALDEDGAVGDDIEEDYP